MDKQEILQRILDSFEKEKDNKARNSMGTYEKFYNPYYMVGRCFEDFEELKGISEEDLNRLIRLADFASETFY